MEIKMIKCGTHVQTVLSEIKGIITAISIRFNRVSYEISYFNNNTYTSIWIDESEFKVINKKAKNNIGYDFEKISTTAC